MRLVSWPSHSLAASILMATVRNLWLGGHSRLGLAVALVITGGSVASTVTLNVQVDVLPNMSAAVTVTAVVPTGKVLPDGGCTVTTGAPSQSSIADASKLYTTPSEPAHVMVVSVGHTISGAVVSGSNTGSAGRNVEPRLASRSVFHCASVAESCVRYAWFGVVP